jgi:hypothetical protein
MAGRVRSSTEVVAVYPCASGAGYRATVAVGPVATVRPADELRGVLLEDLTRPEHPFFGLYETTRHDSGNLVVPAGPELVLQVQP